MEPISLTPSDIVFRPIEGFPAYHISNIGTVLNWKTEKLLKHSVSRDGYCHVQLSLGGVRKNKIIHRLVAEAFLLNPEGKVFVDHIDRDKLNNTLQNLRWATPSENNQNKAPQSNNTSGCVGVKARNNKWAAQIWVDHKFKHLGYHATFDGAVAARKAAELQYFGEFQPHHNC